MQRNRNRFNSAETRTLPDAPHLKCETYVHTLLDPAWRGRSRRRYGALHRGGEQLYRSGSHLCGLLTRRRAASLELHLPWHHLTPEKWPCSDPSHVRAVAHLKAGLLRGWLWAVMAQGEACLAWAHGLYKLYSLVLLPWSKRTWMF